MGSLAFVAALQSSEPADPFQGAFDDVAVLAQPGGRFDAPPGDARDDPASAEGVSAGLVVVAFVGVQLARPSAGPPDRLPHRAHTVDHILQQPMVVEVGGGCLNSQRNPGTVTDSVDLGSGLAAIDW